MNDSEPYGFAIFPKISIGSISYEIVDLAADQTVFEITKEGLMRPIFFMENNEGRTVMTAKKISAWSGIYRMFKDEVRHATLDYSISCCSSQTEIQVGTKRYLGSRLKGYCFEFVDLQGKLAFYFQRYTRLLNAEYLVEVYDNIEPEVAIMASVILDIIIRGQQSVVTAAGASAVT